MHGIEQQPRVQTSVENRAPHQRLKELKDGLVVLHHGSMKSTYQYNYRLNYNANNNKYASIKRAEGADVIAIKLCQNHKRAKGADAIKNSKRAGRQHAQTRRVDQDGIIHGTI
jgi:hypothetical protein